MVLYISIAFLFIGIWLVYLNRVYVGVNPIFQSGFVCFIAAGFLFAGSWANGFFAPLPEPLAIVFPIYLLILFGFIIYDLPVYTYREACNIIQLETEQVVVLIDKEPLHLDGQYLCYTANSCYTFDPITGDYATYNVHWSFE